MSILGGKYENIKLGTKLSLGFGSVLLLSLIVLISGIFGFRSVAKNNDNAAITNQLNATLAQARILRVQFQFTHDYSFIDKNGELLNQMESILRQANAIGGSQAIINDLESISQDLKNYRATREAFLATSKKRDAAGLKISQEESEGVLAAFYGKWNKANGIPADTQVMLFQLGQSMADIRDVAHDLLLAPSANTLAITLKSIDDAEKLIKERNGQLTTEMQVWLKNSWDYFLQYRQSAPAYLAAFQEETNAGQAMSAAADKLNTDVADLFNQQLENSAQTTRSSEVKMLFTSLAVILLGIIMAWRISVQIVTPIKLGLSVAERIANGDLSSSIHTTRRDELGMLITAMAAMNDKLRTMIHDIRAGVGQVALASAEIAAGNADLSSRTEQQSAAVVETAASMEQLTSTVKQNSENAHHASQLASEASQNAIKGGDIVSNVVKTMDEISGSSKRISEITSVINSIAFQTNILALNAAVEAARAGSKVRGFAVVASEVRNLAQRSSQAAKEIEGLIHESVSRVNTGSALVDEAGKTMQDIVRSVTHVFDIMGEIASASDEQSRGISQIAQAVSELDTTTQQNAALVEESSSAANSLEDQAQRLAHTVSVFHLGDDRPSHHDLHSHHDKHGRSGSDEAPLLLAKPRATRKPAQKKGAPHGAGKAAKSHSADDEWVKF
ncbi:methyl-accepting chemotaxis protein [Dickeya aquatica]|uniref:Methyl-accepting chemotaxis protein I (Serine chemoreceptor protein) n=1 Tax=Dickeya aquatica TaxID=1401087 RepID=A0A375ACU4_9GAMM|nr:methyl-accepting chemotaxis protein [Dickeya aquatica]SLM63419.1 Methyl-accepting chemotaxis protein I (serine chemoreceptor protein) [Dickeya aquatica]